VEPETLAVLKADDTLTRWYVNPANGGANLFVAYFKTQRTGQSPHSPKNCLPGAGWTPSSTGLLDVPIPATGETIRINRYVVSKGDSKSVVLYWYQTQSRVIADEFAAKFYLVSDSIKHHRSDTALVRVVVPVIGDHEQQAIDQGEAFVQSVYPVLRSYLPS
jgi:EpsI family protein